MVAVSLVGEADSRSGSVAIAEADVSQSRP
jgi:hypothetical protein